MQLSTASGIIDKSKIIQKPDRKTILQRKALLVCEQSDSQYIRPFKDLLKTYYGSPQISISYDTLPSKEHFKKATESFDYIFIANPNLVSYFTSKGSTHTASAGSFYEDKFLILPPLAHLYSVPYASFLFQKLLDKVYKPENFLEFPQFTWERVIRESDYERAKAYLDSCIFIGADIETTKFNRGISCISFSGLDIYGNIRTYLFDVHDPNFFARIKAICQNPVPKVFQNGLYDNLYLIRFGCAVYNWTFDTMYFQHSWYSESPKDLGWLSSIYLRNHQYWKKEGKYATSLEEYHRYCCKDSFSTLCIAITQLHFAPAWAKNNFKLNWGNFFPSLFCAAHGLRVNQERLASGRAEKKKELEVLEKSLATMTNTPEFNANSTTQVPKLFSLFGFGDEDSYDEKNLQRLASKHPLVERFVEKILEVRQTKKAIGTYYKGEIDREVWQKMCRTQAKEGTHLFHGRFFYSLDPSGTETGRLASRASAFWCGSNIQNQPPYVKNIYQADEGFTLVEIDNEQSETFCSAFLSEEQNLLANICDRSRNFHTKNIELFFGEPYEVAAPKVKEGKKSGTPYPKYDLGKKINHGATYNMGPDVFIDTVIKELGHKFLLTIRKELRIPPEWSNRKLGEYCLSLFEQAYPGLKRDWYPKIVKEIAFTNKLVSPTGWVRYFFKQPASSKHAMNLAVAHGPQSLSVQILNKGFRRIFWEIQLVEPENFRLLAQIHDSILAEIRTEHLDRLLPKMQNCMANEITVNGRKLLIPTEAKICGQFWKS